MEEGLVTAQQLAEAMQASAAFADDLTASLERLHPAPEFAAPAMSPAVGSAYMPDAPGPTNGPVGTADASTFGPEDFPMVEAAEAVPEAVPQEPELREPNLA